MTTVRSRQTIGCAKVFAGLLCTLKGKAVVAVQADVQNDKAAALQKAEEA